MAEKVVKVKQDVKLTYEQICRLRTHLNKNKIKDDVIIAFIDNGGAYLEAIFDEDYPELYTDNLLDFSDLNLRYFEGYSACISQKDFDKYESIINNVDIDVIEFLSNAKKEIQRNVDFYTSLDIQRSFADLLAKEVCDMFIQKDTVVSFVKISTNKLLNFDSLHEFDMQELSYMTGSKINIKDPAFKESNVLTSLANILSSIDSIFLKLGIEVEYNIKEDIFIFRFKD